MKITLFLCFFLITISCFSQRPSGIVTGSVVNEKNMALSGATIQLSSLPDSGIRKLIAADANGNFSIDAIPFGYYRLRVTYTGFVPLILDSLHFRLERFDFNLNDLQLVSVSDSSKMEEIIIYAEKPLIQSKDGNIIFNPGESALSAGSSTSELLNSVPLITKDPTGKLLVRGKEPKILIDDKPVELNLEQLQDLLESMPGSSIEKIEVMTNPPPQYANQQGGVINIVTKKGTIGKSGRISMYGGTRGEAGINTSFNYRKRNFALTMNAGAGYNNFIGDGYSRRDNYYADSTNYFNTDNAYRNRNLRPNFRANASFDPDKNNSLTATLQYNGNHFNNRNTTDYQNMNRFKEVWRRSDRTIRNNGNTEAPSASVSWLRRTKKLGESIRIIADMNYSIANSTREFYQRFLDVDGSPYADSTQQQLNETRSRGHNLRASYELPFSKTRTYFSFGGFYNFNRSDVDADASYRSKTDGSWQDLDALTNRFRFRQKISNVRESVKQVFKDNFSATVGLNAERTQIAFDLYKTGAEVKNAYFNLLPFATLNRNWKDVINLTFAYRRSIRRPGIGELNPTIDFSDPYNLRFGNPGLLASRAHNFDLVLGRNSKRFYVNFGTGFNSVEDIFSQVKALKPGGITETTWENISGRKEYEASTWSGYTVSKQLKINLSASYTYNEYSNFDKTVRKFRNGGSLTSNMNLNYLLKEIYSATGSFTFNRFANPQGTVRSSLSMNIGLQARLMKKKLTTTLNIIDPFIQQKNRTVTFGTNFKLESYSATQTRNFRLSIAYNLSKTPKKKPVLPVVKKKPAVPK